MVRYGAKDARGRKSSSCSGGGHRERELSNRVVGALGEFGDFFAGDQLVLYINDRAARIIRRDFSVRVHLPRANFSSPLKLIALTRVEGTLKKKDKSLNDEVDRI